MLTVTLRGEKMMLREMNPQNDDSTFVKKFLGTSVVLKVMGKSVAKVV